MAHDPDTVQKAAELGIDISNLPDVPIAEWSDDQLQSFLDQLSPTQCQSLVVFAGVLSLATRTTMAIIKRGGLQ